MSVTSLNWQRHAACHGKAELFFGPEDEHARARLDREAQAKAICWTCPVRLRCLTYRLSGEQQLDGGVWGGKGELERRQMRRNMLRAQRRRVALCHKEPGRQPDPTCPPSSSSA